MMATMTDEEALLAAIIASPDDLAENLGDSP
jgi:hypothetical protein